MRNLLDLDAAGLEAFVAGLGEKPFRARQLLRWIHRRGVAEFTAMTDLARSLRERLAGAAVVAAPPVISDSTSADGTRKWLLDVGQGNAIETVFIPEEDRGTLCVSSQAGCAMNCLFCATGRQGFNRNLTTAEIIGQLWWAEHALRAQQGVTAEHERVISNVVLMGMGEPLHNYNNVWSALRRLIDPEAFGLGARHITLSTVGLVPMIDRMADEGLQIGLAVSLHAPNDELRTQLTPINKAYSVDELLAAVRRYVAKTNRRVTFEYALMAGVNDSPELAQEMAHKLQGILCHVNLIPLNPIPDSPFQPTSDEETERFAQILRNAGIPTTIRLRRGIEINAGCGQLRRAMAASGNGRRGVKMQPAENG